MFLQGPVNYNDDTALAVSLAKIIQSLIIGLCFAMDENNLTNGKNGQLF